MKIKTFAGKDYVSVSSILHEIKIIKKIVKKYRKERAGLGWLEARLNGVIIDLEDKP